MSETIDAPAPADNAAPVTTPPADAAPPSDWRASLPPEIRDAPSVAKFNDVGALAKSYLEAEKKIGQKGVIVPGENATPEEQAAFRAALGVPDAPDAYGLKAPEGIPAEVWSEDNANAFATEAHKLGLTPAQAQGIAAWWAGSMAQQMASVGLEPDGRTWEDVLKTEWGTSFDAKLDLAKRAVKEFGADAATLEAFEAKAGGAALMRMFARIGEKVGEDKPAGMGGESAPVVNNPRQQAMAITNDKASPYWNQQHPDHLATVRQVTKLLEEANRRGV
jgi:hypothetical protein